MKLAALRSLALTLPLALAACETDPPKDSSKDEGNMASTGVKSAVSGSTSSPSMTSSPPIGAASIGTTSASQGASASHLGGNAERGKGLVEAFECNRCHDVEGHAPAAKESHCVQCHDSISTGKFPAPADAMARWKKTVDPYTVTPSLLKTGARLKPDWLYHFLLSPSDVRPHLDQSMPRLDLTEENARDLVAYLTASAGADPGFEGGNEQHGRDLIEQKSCTTCHAFSGVTAFATRTDTSVTDEQQKRGLRLAPDLRFTRERFRGDAIVRWLIDPKGMKSDTLMPAHSLNEKEAKDIAAYLYRTELSEVPPKAIPTRLPVLERRVAFDEVMEKVFGVTCRHCHSDPDASLGDGGPGNTGGFGFTPKGLNLSTYRGVAAGYMDDKKERQSVFLPLDDGTPRLLAVLLARQMEESGQRHDAVRGMPLGLPAATPEQVQLVETWIAQGRPN